VVGPKGLGQRGGLDVDGRRVRDNNNNWNDNDNPNNGALSFADLKRIEEAFAERVLAQLHKRELITDEIVHHLFCKFWN